MLALLLIFSKILHVAALFLGRFLSDSELSSLCFLEILSLALSNKNPILNLISRSFNIVLDKSIICLTQPLDIWTLPLSRPNIFQSMVYTFSHLLFSIIGFLMTLPHLLLLKLIHKSSQDCLQQEHHCQEILIEEHNSFK